MIGQRAWHNAIRSDDKPAQSPAMKPDDIVVVNGLGLALQKQKILDQGLATFGKVLTIEPNAVEVRYNRGNTLGALHRFDEALAASRMPLHSSRRLARCNER